MDYFYSTFRYDLVSAGLLVFASALYISSTAIYNLYLHPLSQIPGEKLWTAFRFPYILSMFRGDLHLRMHAMHEKYGPVVRLAPNELSYIDPQAWKDIYAYRPGHELFGKNHTWFRKVSADEPNSIMTPDEADHARFRKIFAHAFSDKSLREQAPMMESYVGLLVTQLRSKCTSGPVELVEWLNFTTFDIAGDLCFGESFSNLAEGKAHPWVEISYDFGKGVALIAALNNYPPFQNLLKYILPAKARQRFALHKAITHEKVAKRMELGKERPDIISTVEEQAILNKERIMSIPEIDINMSILIFAGSENTTNTVAAVIRSLLQNEQYMPRFTEEIRSAFKSEQEITMASAARLPFMNACIEEGMRLSAPVTIGIPRLVPAGGDTICNQWIPGGTLVAVNQFAAYRSASNFSLPDTFFPERFLSEGARDGRPVFQPFGVGRHNCIGMSMAYAEVRLILARLFYAFDFELADDGDRWDWGTQKTHIFWEKKPLRVKLTAAKFEWGFKHDKETWRYST